MKLSVYDVTPLECSIERKRLKIDSEDCILWIFM